MVVEQNPQAQAYAVLIEFTAIAIQADSKVDRQSGHLSSEGNLKGK